MPAKPKLNGIEILISKALIGSCIIHGEVIQVNNLLNEFSDMREAVKNLKTSTVYQKFKSVYKTMLSYCLKC